MEPREGHETPPSSPSRACCLSTYVFGPWCLLIDGALPKILIELTTKNNFENLQRPASFSTIGMCPATTLIWSSPDCFGTPLSYIELLLSTNCWQFSVCVGESTRFAPKWGLEIDWTVSDWTLSVLLSKSRTTSGGKLPQPGKSLWKTVISRHSFRLISLLKILVGLTKTQAKGKHNSAVRARHSSNRQTPIWPFGVYVYISLAFFRAWSRNNLHWLLT